MPGRGGEKRAGPVLLVGSGRRSRELGAVLSALAVARASENGELELQPQRALGLQDLEELLAKRPKEGTLILDYERVPNEDVGFVRRFLERNQGWRLLVLGEESGDRRARALLGLGRAQWVPWPPDLDQVGALLVGGDTAANGDAPPARPAATVEVLDLGELLEEVIAGLALEGDGAQRIELERDGTLPMQRERAPLAEGLTGLLALAVRCVAEKGRVRVRAEIAPADGDPADTVRLRIDFTSGPLEEASWAGLLDEPFGGAEEVATEVETAQKAAATLRGIGCRVSLFTRKPDRLRLEIHVSAEALTGDGGAAGRGKAEDPFA